MKIRATLKLLITRIKRTAELVEAKAYFRSVPVARIVIGPESAGPTVNSVSPLTEPTRSDWSIELNTGTDWYSTCFSL